MEWLQTMLETLKGTCVEGKAGKTLERGVQRLLLNAYIPSLVPELEIVGKNVRWKCHRHFSIFSLFVSFPFMICFILETRERGV